MSLAAAHYAKFKEEAVRNGRVFTFTQGGYLVFLVHQHEVVPFWSSRSRLEKIRVRTPKYRTYEIEELDLKMFLQLLESVEKDSIYIGVNWSGERLNGYDVPARELSEGLREWKNRLEID